LFDQHSVNVQQLWNNEESFHSPGSALMWNFQVSTAKMWCCVCLFYGCRSLQWRRWRKGAYIQDTVCTVAELNISVMILFVIFADLKFWKKRNKSGARKHSFQGQGNIQGKQYQEWGSAPNPSTVLSLPDQPSARAERGKTLWVRHKARLTPKLWLWV
jgi:hypothetical protein